MHVVRQGFGEGMRRLLLSCLSGCMMFFATPQAALAQASASAAFELSCASCHTVKQGEGVKYGPNLYGIVGKASGSAPDFPYSDALAGGKIIWTEQMLDQFLENPDRAAPGTAMPFGGLTRQGDRAEIISFLSTFAPTDTTGSR